MTQRADGERRKRRFSVVPSRDQGWEVKVERAPGVMSSTYCSDWHRVERIVDALEQQLRETRAASCDDQN